ncbi:MAG: hypothetical protein K9L70_05890 [Thiohalocapsa sp.]|nr:hypothetical protein [Thiohalocapsa sp.]MCF7988947.1 hypothetical protein [Thiohalocapsa sp.]
MQAVIDRAYCLRHPGRIVRLFGLDVYMGLLLNKRKTLLERVTEKYRTNAVAVPGAVGNAYSTANRCRGASAS